jgi:hypothetical protein
VSQMQRIQAEQKTARHSICNSTELIKRLQAHLKGKDAAALIKNDEISASCDSLVSKHCNEEMTPAGGKSSKVFCRNCGFTVIPAEILQACKCERSLNLNFFSHKSSLFSAVQNHQGRISMASSIADSLPSMRYDESLQSIAAIRKWQKFAVSNENSDSLK